MPHNSHNTGAGIFERSGNAAKWSVVAILAIIASCLVMELGFAPSPADAGSVGTGQGRGVFAVAGRVTKDTYGIYLVDLNNKTICMYQLVPGARVKGRRAGKIEFMASRTFRYDVQLDDWNNEYPSPAEVKKLVQQSRRLGDNVSPPSR